MTKQIIDGLIYDTDNAVRLAGDSKHYGIGDGVTVKKSVWRTRNGRYFMLSEYGTIASQHFMYRLFGIPDDRSTHITALKETNARDWLQHYGSDALGVPQEA